MAPVISQSNRCNVRVMCCRKGTLRPTLCSRFQITRNACEHSTFLPNYSQLPRKRTEKTGSRIESASWHTFRCKYEATNANTLSVFIQKIFLQREALRVIGDYYITLFPVNSECFIKAINTGCAVSILIRLITQ